MKAFVAAITILGLILPSISFANECVNANVYAAKILTKIEQAAVGHRFQVAKTVKVVIDCYQHGNAKESDSSTIRYAASNILHANFEDEIAGTLAHELAHLLKRHSEQNCEKTHRCENEADELGLILMAGAGYNPHFFGVELTRDLLSSIDLNQYDDLDLSSDFFTYDDGVHLPLYRRLAKISQIILMRRLRSTSQPVAIPKIVKRKISLELLSDD